ncbi:hypothetical protein SELSPUOL_00696 [Selenomonas sputigena ATCC 35185]|uniref:Uncharacterized protein n=1 Tax=Selenomonas sputigena (strain ATCC 35185 / DSM 20758 / CCUG 44933 / VPI D19B-28) TaxID=546271 RepID=C9LTB3_SELS3|nr:hypothetical protein SELSPUOL_00696 [Selenomonas sputigena ATCC 35185]
MRYGDCEKSVLFAVFFCAKTTRTNVHFVDIVRRPYRSLANRSAPLA